MSSPAKVIQKPNPFKPKDIKRDEHIQFLFDQINEWFFGTDSTHFDPTFFENIEDVWNEFGILSDRQYEGLQNIYEQWVCN